jgi:uncharacterized radical SAM superfamily Fe-S cluster-containing enzyme
MTGGMHFTDRYNYDTERVRRRVIQHSTSDGLYPICAINSGPTYRPYIEALCARPLASSSRGAPSSSDDEGSAAPADPSGPVRS